MTDLERERLRQAELDGLGLDTFAETAFDDLTHAAADALKTPIATITIVDGEWQWFKSKFGLTHGRAPRADAFSDHAIRSREAFFIVEDASKDSRFAKHPLVTGEPHVRFYAAAPLRLSSGRAIGTLDVMDSRPRKVDPAKLEQLKFMADQVVATLEARRAAKNPPSPETLASSRTSPLAIAKASLQAFVDKDRSAIEALLGPDFRFTSSLDHALDRDAYLRVCWPHRATMQSAQILYAAESGDRAFIVYEAKVSGKRFRNSEMHVVRDGRLSEVEVYFGWELPHPLARNTHAEPDSIVDLGLKFRRHRFVDLMVVKFGMTRESQFGLEISGKDALLRDSTLAGRYPELLKIALDMDAVIKLKRFRRSFRSDPQTGGRQC